MIRVTNDYFQYDQYEKMVFAMNDYHPKPKKNGKPGKFDFLIDFVDTLDVGTTILPVSEKEKVESVYYRKEPKSEKRIVKGNKSSGVDEIFSRDGIQQFLNEVFREVDISRMIFLCFYRDLSVRCLLSDRIITNIICSIR